MKASVLVIFAIGAMTLLSCFVSTIQDKPSAIDSANTSVEDKPHSSSSRQRETSGIVSDNSSEDLNHKNSPKSYKALNADLDARVAQIAEKMGEDPKTYKMLVKEEDSHTKIYRQVGTYIIVNDGKVTYLPDEF